jgi:hypothetical protein
MANPEVQDARQDLRDAKLDEKVREIREEAAQYEVADETKDIAPALSIRSDRGMVEIQVGNTIYRVAGYADYKETKEVVQKLGQGAEKLAGKAKMIRKLVKALEDRQHDGYGYGRRLGDAQSSTHHELVAYRSDMSGLLTLINGGLPMLNAFISGVNRLDVANPTLVGMAEVVRTYGDKATTEEMKMLVNILHTVLNMLAFYDPVEGLASVFTAKGYSLTGYGTAAPGTPGAATYIIT